MDDLMEQVWTEEHRRFITDFAARIRKKAEGGVLRGVPVDVNDPDTMIVFAYLMAQNAAK